jgi:mannose-6-phosphate isomerase-like protein (cupin superfamily)
MSETVIQLGPGEGRSYPCGPMRAVFKADGEECGSRYSVSEWWVEPQRVGVDPHKHDANEELFYVVKGVMTFHVDGGEVEAPAGSFLRIPAGVMHGFWNRSGEVAGVLNVFIPGGFEPMMPQIVDWYAEHPEGV